MEKRSNDTKQQVLEFKDEIQLRQNQAQQELRFSVAKASIQSQMSVRSSIRLFLRLQNPSTA